MSKGKKLLGLLMAVGLSVGMSVTPVLAETTSILMKLQRKSLRMRKLQKIFPRTRVTVSCEKRKSEFWKCKNSEG